jgi:hypothetical protein
VKRVLVRPAAAADIEDAYEWYESRQSGLGDEFLDALRTIRSDSSNTQKPIPCCTATLVAF